MTDKAVAARRAYKRAWAKQNRDKVREYQNRYWHKKAEQQEAAAAPAEPQQD